MATCFEGTNHNGIAFYTSYSDTTGEVYAEYSFDLGDVSREIEYQFLSACVKQGLPHPAIDRTSDCTPVFDENEDLIWEDYDPEGCLPEYESPFPDYHGEEFRACSELWTYPVAEEVEVSLEADIAWFINHYSEAMDKEATILATFARPYLDAREEERACGHLVDQLMDACTEFRVNAKLLNGMRQAEERLYDTRGTN